MAGDHRELQDPGALPFARFDVAPLTSDPLYRFDEAHRRTGSASLTLTRISPAWHPAVRAHLSQRDEDAIRTILLAPGFADRRARNVEALAVGGSLLGTTTNPGAFQPQGTFTFNGGGNASSPKLLEVMGKDLGTAAAGFTTGNFAYPVGADNPAGCPHGREVHRGIQQLIAGTASGAANTQAAIGTVIPNSGSLVNGVRQAGDGIAKTSYVWPKLVVAPRMGFAYDLSGNQNIILRGGVAPSRDNRSLNEG